MDEQQIVRALKVLQRELLRTQQNLAKANASITAMKGILASVVGVETKAFLAELEQAEKTALEATPVFQQAQEVSEIMEWLDKYPPNPDSLVS
jgi:hypothetical protein